MAAAATGKISAKAVEKADKMKAYLDQHMKAKFTAIAEKNDRRAELDKTMETMKLPEDVRRKMQAKLQQEESNLARASRKKMSTADFEFIAKIGAGAFGEVRVCRLKTTKEVYAMKIMKKSEMLKKNQATHIRAERDDRKENRMSLTYQKKIVKSSKAAPTEIEKQLAQALFDLELNSADLKQELRHLHIVAAKEIDCGNNKKAIVIFVPYRLLPAFRRIHYRLVHELEKKFSGKHVVVIGQRRILKAPTRKNKVKSQKRPRSRTLTAVHDAVLEDIVYPAEISGKRIRYKTDASKTYKVYLDKKDQQQLEHKLETFSSVYKKITGKTTLFTFKAQSDRSF